MGVDSMRIALISDIHGNLPALEKVAADIDREKVDSVVFLGDLVFLGLYPQECHDLMLALDPMCCIKGNTDANLEELSIFNPEDEDGLRLKRFIEYADIRLHESAKIILAGRCVAQRIDIQSKSLMFCHGSPYSFKDQLQPGSPGFPTLSQRIAEERFDAVFCGHIHQPMQFQIGATLVFNPGAVGYSFDGDVRASYGILTLGESITCSIRRVDYDIDRYRREVEAQQPAFKDMLLHLLQTGRPFRRG
jgi:putative phosphoesterase